MTRTYSVDTRRDWNTGYQNQARKDALENPKPKAESKGGPSLSKDVGFGTQQHSGIGGSTSGTAPGGIDYDAYYDGPSFSVDGKATGDVSRDGISLDIDIEIDATLVEAGASAEKTFEVELYGEKFEVTVDLAAMGKIGANGKLNLSLDIGRNGVEVSANVEGFAGAKASITGGISLSHNGNEILSGEATLSGYAGVSGQAGFDASFNGGNIEFEASASASAGAGFGFELDGNFNTGNAARAAAAIFQGALREGVDEVAETAAQFAENTAEFLGDVGENLKDLAGNVGGFVVDSTGKIVDGVGNAWNDRPDWLF